MTAAPTTADVQDLVPDGVAVAGFVAGFAPPHVDPSGPWRVEVVDYPFGSPATGALLRVVQQDGDDPWSVFVKVINHLRHWPAYRFLPPEFAERFAAEFPWRGELVLWDEAFTGCLPAGLRVPGLHVVADLGDDRLAIWMEDVRTDDSSWTPARYSRAAELLGEFTARRADPELLRSNGYPVGFGLRKFALEGLPQQLAGALDDDGAWARPDLRELGDLRARLLDWRNRIPALLDRMDATPQSLPHGDASPSNLLVPAGPDAAEFVVIDCSFQSPQAIGFDLGQLLVGAVQAGDASTEGLPALRDAVLEAFLRGLARDPVVAPAVEPDDVRAAFAGAMLIRSGFGALRLRDGSPTVGDHADERSALTRFVLDTADAWCR